MNLDEMRKLSQECARRTEKASRLHKSAVRRYNSFSWFKRTLWARRFSDLKKRIKRFEVDRFNNTAIFMHLARSIKFQERRLRARS